MGSPALTVSLIELGLVDELRVMVHPIVLGGGRSLFRTTQVLQSDVLDGHGGVAHRTIGADQQGALAVGVGGPDDRGHAARPGRPSTSPSCSSSR
jgi:hypothetical protein